jgi:hypothetical protein
MATNYYNNIPPSTVTSSDSSTVQFFNQYYQVPVELNSNSLVAMKGFFEKRGFGANAAESTALIILSQAKNDNLNEFQILDTLGGLNSVQISALVGEILNYNRFKTSSLGLAAVPTPADEIQRNILA